MPIDRQSPLDPVYDTQRRRIWLPPGSMSGRVFIHPTRHQPAVSLCPVLGSSRVQVIEVMKVVSPQLFDTWVVPTDIGKPCRLVKEREHIRFSEAGESVRGADPLPSAGPPNPRGGLISYSSSSEARPETTRDLNYPEVADRMEVGQWT